MSALNVVELGNAIKLGHLDASIVWDATAALYKKTELETIPLPEKFSVYSPIPVGVLVFSKHPKEAERYMNFLASDEAAKVFIKYGYSVPKKQARTSK
jgi:molybdate transport system substrate-binding protein